MFGQATTGTNVSAILGSTYNTATNVNNNSNFAGFFNGNFLVVGGTKSAGVPHPDGSYRALYCVESPESWFEDFGVGSLAGGKADVTLDPDFAAVVDTKDMHVFIAQNDGQHHHLSVSGQTRTGFTVAADTEIAVLKGKKTADLNGTFSWRVVARRKDVKVPRLAKIELPNTHTPDAASLPKLSIP